MNRKDYEQSNNQKMTGLRLLLLNDTNGLDIEESEGLFGYILRDPTTRVACYTAYVSPGGFSSFRAVMDAKGYDLSDEQALVSNDTVFRAVNAIVKDHKQHCPNAYPRTREIWEGASEELCPFWDYRK